MDWRVTTLIWIVRLVGLGLLVYVIHPTAGMLSFLWRELTTPPPQPNRSPFVPDPWNFADWMNYAIQAIPTVTLLLLALHLLLGGRWLIRRMLRGLDGSCPACGHQLPDGTATRCIECGFRFAQPRFAPPPPKPAPDAGPPKEPTP